MSELAILVPVLNRPHRIEPLLQSISEATTVPHRVLFGCSDQPTVDVLDRLGCTYIRDEGGAEGTWAKRINRLYRETNEQFVMTAADDLGFRPGWFEAVRVALDRIPGGGVVAVNDLHNMGGVHFVLTRSYIETMNAVLDQPPGVICCQDYVHSYVDDEIRITAVHHGRWGGVITDAVVEHLHPGAGKGAHDAVYAAGEASMAQGHAMFLSRSYLWS